MSPCLQQLFTIAQKEERTIIGLMSGTSLDGLDIAVCKIKGSGESTQLLVTHFTTVDFTTDFKEEIKKVFSKENVSLQQVCLLNEYIAKEHAKMINACLREWKISNKKIDAIASHGQTIYHAPEILHGRTKFGNGTLQIGDGDHLAVQTGIICLSDFRQKHIAAGGEGAPLAAYGDLLLFKEPGTDVILLNIGGIANFTYLPADNQNIFSTDTGPGNGMMDAYIQMIMPGTYYDNNAALAKKGKINDELLGELKKEKFFNLAFPKTTGPELFNVAYLQRAQVNSNTNSLNEADVMATLNRFTSETITDAIKNIAGFKNKNGKIYISGGGMHNPLIKEYLEEYTGLPICSTAEKQINPDAKEAILFAVLANETLAGDADFYKKLGAKFPAVSMGKISLPG
ncbi:MAG: anhydro-N-acetylmuramic acid kinase [Ginsengibacter sp.]